MKWSTHKSNLRLVTGVSHLLLVLILALCVSATVYANDSYQTGIEASDLAMSRERSRCYNCAVSRAAGPADGNRLVRIA
ncbi:MAG: hypothetical protein QNK19_04700 [Xanthomonadales bacterium]|nr:hypothetical protein [Xanthomonadales bacterium]